MPTESGRNSHASCGSNSRPPHPVRPAIDRLHHPSTNQRAGRTVRQPFQRHSAFAHLLGEHYALGTLRQVLFHLGGVRTREIVSGVNLNPILKFRAIHIFFLPSSRSRNRFSLTRAVDTCDRTVLGEDSKIPATSSVESPSISLRM